MIVPLGVNMVVFAVFAMLTCGTGGTVTVLLHGGVMVDGVHELPGGGAAVAVFVTCAGGLALTVAVTV
jgi:hypothetical protein